VAFTYDYPRPGLTTDAVVVRTDPELQVLLIQRKAEPFKGGWALPGGFLDEHEDLDACVRRELEEEAGLIGLELHPLANFSRPGRDPRGWTVSAAYVGLASGNAEPKAGDDAAAVRWFPLAALPPLAFDHGQIIAAAIGWLHRHAQAKGVDAARLPPLAITQG
jgi:8-oxo-dGTP diphosphatase